MIRADTGPDEAPAGPAAPRPDSCRAHLQACVCPLSPFGGMSAVACTSPVALDCSPRPSRSTTRVPVSDTSVDIPDQRLQIERLGWDSKQRLRDKHLVISIAGGTRVGRSFCTGARAAGGIRTPTAGPSQRKDERERRASASQQQRQEGPEPAVPGCGICARINPCPTGDRTWARPDVASRTSPHLPHHPRGGGMGHEARAVAPGEVPLAAALLARVMNRRSNVVRPPDASRLDGSQDRPRGTRVGLTGAVLAARAID